MGRYYKLNGKKLPSVTTITGQLDKPALMPWAANCAVDYILENIENNIYVGNEGPPQPELINVATLYPIIESARKNFRKVSAQALDIGSATHQAIEHYLLTGKEPQAPSDQVLSAFLAFLEWLDTWDSYETIETEHTVYADDYAGTCDWIVLLNGKKYVVDFKSSKGIYKPEYNMQVAAYRACIPDCEGNGVLRLDKESGLPEWKDFSDSYEKDLKSFRHLVDYFHSRKEE